MISPRLEDLESFPRTGARSKYLRDAPLKAWESYPRAHIYPEVPDQ